MNDRDRRDTDFREGANQTHYRFLPSCLRKAPTGTPGPF
jgi:hypothetical protein